MLYYNIRYIIILFHSYLYIIYIYLIYIKCKVYYTQSFILVKLLHTRRLINHMYSRYSNISKHWIKIFNMRSMLERSKGCAAKATMFGSSDLYKWCLQEQLILRSKIMLLCRTTVKF